MRQPSHLTLRFVALLALAASGCIGTDVGNPGRPTGPPGGDQDASPSFDSGGADDAPISGAEDTSGETPEPDTDLGFSDANDAPDPTQDASMPDTSSDVVVADDIVDTEPLPLVFVPFPTVHTFADPLVDRLCDEVVEPVEDLEDATFLNCRVVGGSFAPDESDEVPDDLNVLVWNLERGLALDAQIERISAGDAFPIPDVILLSEVDRGCSRSGGRDVARDLAEALGMHWVFAVEFVELPRETGPGGRIEAACEHGNAILSRFPLGNVEAAFHRSNLSWYTPPALRDGSGEPRLGGRSWLRADTLVGDRLVSLVTLHFESRPDPIAVQIEQAAEVGELAAALPTPVVVGGDTNAPLYWDDVRTGRAVRPETVRDATVAAMLEAGLFDVHAELPYALRQTRNAFVLDLLLASEGTWFDAGVCPVETCGNDLSDHRPVFATLALDSLPTPGPIEIVSDETDPPGDDDPGDDDPGDDTP